MEIILQKNVLKKTSEVLKKCFEELIVNKVQLNGIILKPNMVLPGTNSDQKIDNEEIAEITIKCLGESVQKKFQELHFYLEVNLKVMPQKFKPNKRS